MHDLMMTMRVVVRVMIMTRMVMNTMMVVMMKKEKK
jgi:hypothetical protein